MQDQAAYTFEQVVGDAVGAAKALGHDHVTLVVHDWGGMIGWCVAERLSFTCDCTRWWPCCVAQAHTCTTERTCQLNA